MLDLLLVGIGGACGSLSRYQIGKAIALKSKVAFPINTYIINIVGAILLGVLTRVNLDKYPYLFVIEGFLGAFTTFSTFMYEGFSLFRENEKKNAIFYILSTLILGVVGFLVGYTMIGWLVKT